MADLFPMLLAALALMGSPGPATMSCTAMGAAYGWRRALPYVAGIMAGTGTVTLMIAAGITGLLLAIPGARIVLVAGGTAYILYLAWKIATAPPLERSTDHVQAPGFFAAWLFGIANPKAYAAVGSVYAGFTLVPDNLPLDSVAKIGVLFAVNAFVNPTWMMVGSGLSRYFQSPRASRILNWVFASLLIVSVVFAFL